MTHNAQPQPDSRELDEGEEVGGVFLVTHRNATTVFDLVEEPLDVISVAVEVWAEADRIAAAFCQAGCSPGLSTI